MKLIGREQLATAGIQLTCKSSAPALGPSVALDWRADGNDPGSVKRPAEVLASLYCLKIFAMLTSPIYDDDCSILEYYTLLLS